MNSPNPFVYEKTLSSDVRSSTLPAVLPEQYSQCGEDLVVLAILAALEKSGKIEDWSDFLCIEFGANHGYAGSNSYLIGRRLGVRSLLVEANPELINDLRKSRPDDLVVNVALVDDSRKEVDFFVSNHHEISSTEEKFVRDWHGGTVGIREKITVPAIRPNELFAEYLPGNRGLLYLSVDLEGSDLRIVKAIDLTTWRPAILQMEPSEHMGTGRATEMIDYMNDQGFLLFASTNVNLLFLDRGFLTRYFHCGECADISAILTRKDQELKEQLRLLAEKDEILVELEETLLGLRNSWSWRIGSLLIRPMQWLRSLVLAQKTK